MHFRLMQLHLLGIIAPLFRLAASVLSAVGKEVILSSSPACKNCFSFVSCSQENKNFVYYKQIIRISV